MLNLFLRVCSYVVLLHHCPSLARGLIAHKHVKPRLTLSVSVPSHEPVFHWLTLVAVCYICFCFFFCYVFNQAVGVSLNCLTCCYIGVFEIVEGRTISYTIVCRFSFFTMTFSV